MASNSNKPDNIQGLREIKFLHKSQCKYKKECIFLPQNPHVCKLEFFEKKNHFAFFQCCPMHLNQRPILPTLCIMGKL